MNEIAVILFMALADRVRGGFPDDSFWKPNPAPRWKHWLRKSIWYLSGGVLATYLLNPTTPQLWGICLVSSILFTLGARQNMGVIGWIYPGNSKQLHGWLSQLRIGAVWSIVAVPMYFLNNSLWVMIPACMFGPILGALLGRFINPVMPEWCLQLKSQWAWTEFFRGLMIGAIAITLSNIF